MNRTKKMIAVGAVVGVLAAGGAAYAVTSDDTKDCGTKTVAQATVHEPNGKLTIVNPPEHSTSGDENATVTVDGHSAQKSGSGQFDVVCR